MSLPLSPSKSILFVSSCCQVGFFRLWNNKIPLSIPLPSKSFCTFLVKTNTLDHLWMKTLSNTTEFFSLHSMISYCFSTWLNNEAGLSFILLYFAPTKKFIVTLCFLCLYWLIYYHNSQKTLHLKQNIGMQSIATPINHLTAPLILVDLLPKVLGSFLLFFLRGALSVPLIQSPGLQWPGSNWDCLGRSMSALYFCAEAVACC